MDSNFSYCEFCQEFNSISTHVTRVLKKLHCSSRILVEKEGIVSLAAVGGLEVGYCLILPKEHYYSIGELNPSLINEVERQKKLIIKAISQKAGGAICFEHGSTSAKAKGGACIDHAHLHIVPGRLEFREHISKEFREFRIEDMESLRDFSKRQKPYLYLQDISGTSYVYEIPSSIPSQYMRKVWADLYGKPDEWDWQLFPNYPKMKATILLILESLERGQ